MPRGAQVETTGGRFGRPNPFLELNPEPTPLPSAPASGPSVEPTPVSTAPASPETGPQPETPDVPL